MTDPHRSLSRRERQVLMALQRKSPATVAELVDALKDDVSYSAVRATLRMLEIKGQVSHRYDGPRYVYEPVASTRVASRSALKTVIDTFFHGSVTGAVVALLDLPGSGLPMAERKRIVRMLEQARQREDR